jgi:hypothetical protein
LEDGRKMTFAMTLDLIDRGSASPLGEPDQTCTLILKLRGADQLDLAELIGTV